MKRKLEEMANRDNRGKGGSMGRQEVIDFTERMLTVYDRYASYMPQTLASFYQSKENKPSLLQLVVNENRELVGFRFYER